MLCPNCGAVVDFDDDECWNCGDPLDEFPIKQEEY